MVRLTGGGCLAFVLLAGCATAPHPAPPAAQTPAQAAPAAPAPPPPPPPPAVPPVHPLQVSRLICTVQEARKTPFADLGLPAGSRPVDLALGKDRVWILFEPSLLVGLPRAADHEPVAVAEYGAVEETEMIPGPRPDAWRSVSADPLDGTLWLASPTGLWRRRPGRRPELVTITDGSKAPLDVKPAGRRSKKPTRMPVLPAIPVPPGGFRAAVALRGTVWAAPACADHAVWKLDSLGRRLAESLPVPAEPCTAVDLQRNWSGDVLALWPGAAGAVLRLAPDGSWQPAGDALAIPMPPAMSATVPLLSWFFWSAEPLALGGPADDPRLYRRDDRDGGKVTAFHEDCGPGNALVRVAGDAKGWAALTRDWLLVGEHQRIEPRPAPGSD